MCTFCVEVQKNKMTVREVARAYRELRIPDGHESDVFAVIKKSHGLEAVAQELNELYVEEMKKEKI